MMHLTTRSLLGILLLSLGIAGAAGAYTQYSVNKDATNCRFCHGDFRAPTYTSMSDGGTWTNGLHDTHKDVMLDGDCDTCHSTGRFPVILGSSKGGDGLDPIACSGCHGRAEDGTGTGSEGYGAGLRQHHWLDGVTTCGTCHADADPSAFEPADEDVLPPYYAAVDPAHPLIPEDPCNVAADGYTEDYAATTQGLDNDGDGLYDEADLIACPEPGGAILLQSGLALLLLLGRRRAGV